MIAGHFDAQRSVVPIVVQVIVRATPGNARDPRLRFEPGDFERGSRHGDVAANAIEMLVVGGDVPGVEATGD